MNIGIDPGNTYSLISYLNAQGIPALFPDRYDADLFNTASVVSVQDNRALVGQAAEEAAGESPKITVARFMKRHLGSDHSWTDSQGKSWPMSALLGLVFRKLLIDAQIFSHEPIESAVIAVPAHFNDTQRKALLEAASIGGIPDAALLDEPAAVAMYYGVRQDKEQTLFVYDLGGGTFNAAVLQATPDGLYVLSSSGLPEMGGKIFDQHIRETLLDYLRAEGAFQAAAEAENDPVLWRTAEELKIKIGRTPAGRISKTMFIGGYPLEFVLTRRQFEDMIGPDIEKTLQTCRQCLEAVSLGWNEIDRILLVGGSSLIPLVQARIGEETNKPRGCIIMEQPQQAVAYGAALHAAQLAGKNPDTPKLKQGCASQSLGIMIHDKQNEHPRFSPLIHRHSPLPATAKRTFFTNRPNQRRIVLELAQAEGENAVPRSLGHFIFDGIQNPRKNYPIEVTLTYNIDGTIVARAHDQVTGQEMEHTVTNPEQAAQADILKWREEVAKLTINE